MPTSFDLRLGVEEVALALSVQGYPQAAKAILVTTFGELPTDDEGGRLLAAGHSLMARGLLSVDGGESRLETRFSGLVSLIVDPAYMLQLGLRATTGDEERTLSYFFKEGTTVEQRIEQGVVYNLRTVRNNEGIVEAGTAFFELGNIPQQKDTAEIPMALVDKARDLAGTAGATSQETASLFERAKVPPSLARLLADDFQAIQGRGMVMLVENGNGELISDEGFLVMRGAHRTWLFPIVQKSGETYARIVSASPQSFAKEVQRLLGKTGA